MPEKNDNKKGRIILNKLSKEQKQKIKTDGIGAVIGTVGNAGIFSLMSFVSKNDTNLDNPVVNTDENFDDNEAPIIVYTEAPFAESVTDEMSFREAYDSARSEVGAGGIFEWKGNSYNTYTKEEFGKMTDQEKSDYTNSIEGKISFSEDTVENTKDDTIEIDETDNNPTDNDPTEVEIYEGMEFDIDGDGDAEAVVLDIHEDGTIDLAVDYDNDGEMDAVILDLNPREEFTGKETVVDIDDYETNNTDTVEVDLDLDLETNSGEDAGDVGTDDMITFDETDELNNDLDMDNDLDLDEYV
tara:strand:- start:978 stop:1874 length:897 start_codon:yes stop_codon:yes gene_type:complete